MGIQNRLIQTATKHAPRAAIPLAIDIYKVIYVSIFRPGKRVYDLGDFKMGLDLSESRMMVKRRFSRFERHVTDALTESLTEGDVYLDIGSNKGYHALMAATVVGEGGHVYCFEPNPENVDDLHLNKDLNSFDQMTVTEAAVTDSTGSVRFKTGERSGYGMVSPDGGLSVDAITVDTFCEREGIFPSSIGAIKVDVEGREANVFEGMQDVLGQLSNCTLVIEVHNDTDIQTLARHLDNAGMDFEKSHNRYWIARTADQQ